MDMLTVRATGNPVPKEHNAGWIREEPVQVPNSYYYRQMLVANELERVPEEASIQAPGNFPICGSDEPKTAPGPRGRRDRAALEDAPTTLSSDEAAS